MVLSTNVAKKEAFLMVNCVVLGRCPFSERTNPLQRQHRASPHGERREGSRQELEG